jgi:hypothetical protein
LYERRVIRPEHGTRQKAVRHLSKWRLLAHSGFAAPAKFRLTGYVSIGYIYY